uniref:NADH-ubiquinone oxidoreductase chain 5 n=1 Tax=Glossosoma caudatum TaxID=2904899 RepID=A0A9E8LNH3_9NEOP|nr:NADH dehydrogenase subunit 5 [Glossosoma caudatum]UZZ43630.1 NADH dehydrogenase subunit 5 [Glossosoma caudatum]
MNLISICLISFVFLFVMSMTSLGLGLMSIYFNMSMFLEWEIISLNSSSFVMTLILDWMSFLFMSLVMLISSVVIMYSQSYMKSDMTINRFILLVLLFVLSMILLIISPNLISILLGWDGLGLVSYCLVIYYQNVKSYNSGMLTALSNRIGDVAILLSIAWMLNYGGWNYIFYLNFMKDQFYMLIIGYLIVLAAMTKSAQIPFSSWLPAAMAAPTPVSALVHSSTLVTAGVYLLIRFNVLLQETLCFKILLLFASLTMLMSGLSANFEYDMKKIIALSTLSQLGLMMSILSMGYLELAFFHLLTHAMFKALLFMCAGVIIHSMSDFQDIRFMGGSVKFMPLTSICFSLSNLALCGAPFLAGFYSKDLILEIVCMSQINLVIFFFFFFSTGLTVSYSIRLIYFSLIGGFNLFSMFSFHDEDYTMIKSMYVLLVLSIVGGASLSWLIFPTPMMIYLSFHLKFMVMYVIFGGMILGGLIINFSLFNLNKLNLYVSLFFMKLMWFLPNISTFGVNYSVLFLGGKIMSVLDLGWSEFLVGQGLFKNLKKLTIINQIGQLNLLSVYLKFFFIWILILIMLCLNN